MTERHDRFPVTRIVTRIDGRDPLVAPRIEHAGLGRFLRR